MVLIMRWAVKIVKTSLDKRSLQDLLGGLGFTLINDGEALFFSSSKFDNSVSSEDVFKIAKELRNAFTKIDEDFTIGNVLDYSYNPPRCHYLLEVEAGSHKLTSGNVVLLISPPDNLKGQMLLNLHLRVIKRPR